MPNNSEVVSILSRFPKFEDTWLGLSYAPHMPKHMVKETREVIAIARKFNEEVAKPLALKLDRLTHEDPDYLPWELIEEANRRGFYTMWIPKIFGGHGYNLPSMSCFCEEVASACAGIMNVIGVHYLAVTGLTASGNTRLAKKILREVAEGERSGKPCTLALATTEPGAGTDVEEVDLVDKGKVTCQAKRVKGGYIVNGTKVFISMGHVSSWTVLYAYEDTKRPSETTIGFVIKTGTKGFSFGSHENKMGQRVCPASVLIFEDCFIPDDQVLFNSDMAKKITNKPARDISQRYCDYVVSATRPGVCAFGIGVARGAFETALHYAATACVNGRLLINQEWAQCMLAEMHKNVILEGLLIPRPTTPTAIAVCISSCKASRFIIILRLCRGSGLTRLSRRCSIGRSQPKAWAKSYLTHKNRKTSAAARAGRRWQKSPGPILASKIVRWP